MLSVTFLQMESWPIHATLNTGFSVVYIQHCIDSPTFNETTGGKNRHPNI